MNGVVWQVIIRNANGSLSYLYYPNVTAGRACDLADAYMAAVCWQAAEVVGVTSDY